MHVQPSWPLLLASACMLGCSGGSGESGASRQKSATLVVSAVAATQADSTSVVVPGGSLELDHALFEIEHVVIEENSGEGEGNHEEDSEGEGEGDEGEEEDDVVLPGPFSLDLASPPILLDAVSLYPGTFRKVHFDFRSVAGHSVSLSGTYRPSAGSPIPVTLLSGFAGEVQVPIANGGITIDANAVVPVALVFDLYSLLGSLDLSSAEVEGGTITIDRTHNRRLLDLFESKLASSVDLDERDA